MPSKREEQDEAVAFEGIFRNTVKRARAGSADDMELLVDLWKLSPSSGKPTELVEIALKHLGEDLVPSTPSGSFSQRARLAYASMKALSNLKIVSGTESRSTIDALFEKRVIESFKGVLKWTEYIFRARVKGLARTDLRWAEAGYMTLRFWFALVSSVKITDLLLEHPSAVEIATRLWIDGDEYVKVIGDAPVIGMGTRVLYAMATRFSTLEQFDAFERATGKNNSIFAKYLVTRFRNMVKNAKTEMFAWDVIARFLTILAHLRPNRSLFKAFLIAGMAPLAAIALVKSDENYRAGHGTYEYESTMHSACLYLRECFKERDAHKWMTQAASMGFYEGLYGAIVVLSRPEGVLGYATSEQILDITPGYLVYPPVIDAIGHSMAKFRAGPYREPLKIKTLQDKWVLLRNLARDRQDVLDRFREGDAEEKQNKTCGNPKCPQKGKDYSATIRKCGGCLGTFYCSKECQKINWNDHKALCKHKERFLQSKRDEDSMYEKRHCPFVGRLSIMEAIQSREEFAEIAKRDFPHLPITELVMCLDGTVYPPAVSMIPLKDFDAEDHRIVGQGGTILESARTDPDHVVLISMTFPTGDSSELLLTGSAKGIWAVFGDKHRDLPTRRKPY